MGQQTLFGEGSFEAVYLLPSMNAGERGRPEAGRRRKEDSVNG
jgi:hypothetical protein